MPLLNGIKEYLNKEGYDLCGLEYLVQQKILILPQIDLYIQYIPTEIQTGFCVENDTKTCMAGNSILAI